MSKHKRIRAKLNPVKYSSDHEGGSLITSRLFLEDYEESIYPPYIRNGKAYALAKQRQSCEDLLSQQSYRKRRKLPPVKKWKVQTKDFNAWRRPTMDMNGSIYSLDGEAFSSMEELSLQPMRSVRPVTPHTSLQVVEREYIRSQPEPAENLEGEEGGANLNFTLHIMKTYNRPRASHTHLTSYGAPGDSMLRPERSTVTKIVDKVVKPSNSLHLVHDYVRPMHFQKPTSSIFCEVLGPAACHDCIEGTNRYVANTVEKVAFPDLSLYSGTALVAPKLSLILARDNKRKLIKEKQKENEQMNYEFQPISRLKRERSITLAIKKRSSKVKKLQGEGDKNASVLPEITSGLPRLKEKVQVKVYNRRWETRANDFFEKDGDHKREVSNSDLSESQKRLREMLDKIKYKRMTESHQ